MKSFFCKSRIISFLLKNVNQFFRFFFLEKESKLRIKFGKGKWDDSKNVIKKCQFGCVFLKTLEF